MATERRFLRQGWSARDSRSYRLAEAQVQARMAEPAPGQTCRVDQLHRTRAAQNGSFSQRSQELDEERRGALVKYPG